MAHLQHAAVLAEQAAARLPYAAAGLRAGLRSAGEAAARCAGSEAVQPGRRWVREEAAQRAALQPARCVEQAAEAVVEGAVALARAEAGVPQAGAAAGRCVEPAVAAGEAEPVRGALPQEGVPVAVEAQAAARRQGERLAAEVPVAASWQRVAARSGALRKAAVTRARLPAPAGSGHRETGFQTKQAARRGSAESRHRPAAGREWSSWKPSLMMGQNRPRREASAHSFPSRRPHLESRRDLRRDHDRIVRKFLRMLIHMPARQF